jgi:hypothetical protein
MKRSLIHRILIYLYEEDVINQNQINVTAFLLKIQNEDNDRENNFNRIVMALGRIKVAGYAEFNCSPETHTLNQVVNGITYNLENTQVNMSFNINGYDYIRNFLRENEQQKSILETNTSVKTLNEQVPKFNTIQIRLTIITSIIAVLSLVAIGVSAYYSSKSITGSQFDSTNKILERNTMILDSIRNYQKEIDSSLNKAVKDSFYRKRF